MTMAIHPLQSFRLALLLAFTAATAFAQLKVPPMDGWLNDTAGMVPADQHAALEQRLADFSTATDGGQLVVLTISTLDGEEIEEYAMRVFEAWQPGRKDIDDGALLVLARDDRRSRLEIGYGWEGDINDARAGDVLRNIAAYLAEGRTADAIASAIAQMQFYITGTAPEDAPPVLGQEEEESAPEPNPADSKIEMGIYIFIAVLFSIILGIGIFGDAPSSSGGGGGGSSRRSSGGYSRSSSSGGGASRGGGGRSGGGGASGRW